MSLHNTRKSFAFKAMSFAQAAIFIFSTFALPFNSYAQSIMDLPAPGALVSASMDYVPVMLRAVKIDPDQPLVFDFIVDSGHTQADRALIKSETERLVKYFLASLTIPEQDLWVNLSPYERERIVPEAFGRTEMGRDLLAQDYILKQLTASLVDPEQGLGKEFWSRVYAKAQEALGSSELPVDTFNKVWIMPDKAEVYEMNNTAIVGQSSLKVLMEEDYLAMQKNMGIERGITAEADETRKISNDIMREIILPEIEREVNTGKNFALLRQVYQALVLATWYKNNLKESLLAQVYADQNKTAGVSVDGADKEVIFQRYIAAYKQGVFNYIKEDIDPRTNETVPRKYFSGGAKFTDMSQRVSRETRKVDSVKQIPVKAQEPTEGSNFNQVTVAMTKQNVPAVKNGRSDFHEQLVNKVYSYAKENQGKLPIPTHKIEKLFRVQDIELKMQNIPKAERERFYHRAVEEFARLKNANAKISMGAMAAGAASRMSKGKLPQLLIDALHEDPEQFVDVSKFTQADRDIIDSEKYKGDFKAYVRDLDGDKPEDHEVLNNILFAPKALLPAAKVDGKWYSLIGYVAMNASKANAQLEGAGLGRPFIADFMLNDEYRPLIVKQMINNDFYGLKVAVVKDDQGNVVDIDENDMSNELVLYQQKLAPRLMAPVEVIEAQWQQDQKITAEADLEPDIQKKQVLLDKRFFKNERQYQYARERSENSTEKVLYNTGVPEGHGERWHAQLETTGVGRQVPLYLEGILRNVQYDYFHNIDNMARVNDDWMVMFGYFVEKDLGLMMESSLRPFTERGGGGGFDFTRLSDGRLVARQTEDSITGPSKTELGFDSTADAIEAGKNVDGIPNQVPVNNATVLSRSAGSIESVRNGSDAISANLTPDQRNELADELERAIATGNYKVDLSRFADMLRNNFETITTLKSIKDPNKKNATEDELVATIVKETFAWSAQEGFLDENKVGIVLTPSIVDVDAFKAQPESVRFNPLKDRLTYDVPAAQQVRSAQMSAVVQQPGAFEHEFKTLRDSGTLQRIKDQVKDVGKKDDAQKGGIDFNPAVLNLKVQRTGKGIQVQVDPAEIQRIRTEGVSGFTPVIINITPVKSMLPALGLVSAETAAAT